MQISNLPVFKVAREKMDFLNARQTVLAQNIANVDTPGYVGRDLQAPDFQKMAAGLSSETGLAQTNARHLPVMSGANGIHYRVSDAIPDERNPDGSRVQLDDQMKRVAETQMQYNLAINVYRKQLALFKTALGNNNGA